MTESDELLTIICMTYNHERFIRKTLEGFVSQKTEYKFKVIVHDDASMDGTKSIIKEYEKKYPDLFQCIYQDTNVYSTKISINQTYIRPLVKGRYVALCEGDDYWCNESKIQLQLSYLLNHPNTVMCVHNTKLIDYDGKDLNQKVNCNMVDRSYSFGDVLKAGGGRLFHTSSFIMKKEIYFDIPLFFKLRGVSDYPLSLYAASFENIHYIGRVMSCYRINNPDSWSGKKMSDKTQLAKHYYEQYQFLQNLEERIKDFKKEFKVAKGRCIYAIFKNKQNPKKYGLCFRNNVYVLNYIVYKLILKLMKTY